MSKERSNRLSAREVEVLWCVSQGMTNERIAAYLHISFDTARAHLRHVSIKLNAKDRANAVSLGYQLGYLTINQAPVS